jgi:hypothetical protein
MIFVNCEFRQLKQKGTVLHHEIGPNPPILLVKIKGSEGVYFEELIPPNEIGSNHVDLVDLKKRVRCRRERERISSGNYEVKESKIMPYWYTCILFIPVCDITSIKHLVPVQFHVSSVARSGSGQSGTQDSGIAKPRKGPRPRTRVQDTQEGIIGWSTGSRTAAGGVNRPARPSQHVHPGSSLSHAPSIVRVPRPKRAMSP